MATSDDFDLFGISGGQSSSSDYPNTNVGPSGPMIGPSGPMVGPSGPMIGPSGPMVGPSGPMVGPSGPGLSALSKKVVKDPDAAYTAQNQGGSASRTSAPKKTAKKTTATKAKKPASKKKA